MTGEYAQSAKTTGDFAAKGFNLPASPQAPEPTLLARLSELVGQAMMLSHQLEVIETRVYTPPKDEFRGEMPTDTRLESSVERLGCALNELGATISRLEVRL